MINRKSLGLALILTLGAAVPQISWGSPESDFAAQASQDFQNVSSFINGQFAPNLGFFSTLGWNTPPTIFRWDSPLGPHLEVGLGVGVDLFKISDQTLNLSVLDQSTETNPGQEINNSLKSVGLSGLPVPYPFATVRVGLFGGLDLGFRYTEIPSVSVNTSSFNVATHYSGYGFDLRYKLLEGHQLPNLTMGVHWNTLSGDIALGASANQTSTFVDSGETYSANVNGSVTYDESWTLNDFGPELSLGYSLLGFITPYVSVGFERYSGSVIAKTNGNATVTLTPVSPISGSPGAPTSIPLNFQDNQPPTTFEAHYTAGLDIGSVWSIVGEANGPSLSVNTSFRAEF
ncbi:MAG TPA: hypothetical protein VMU88_02960 [bacterium]|nr:hypothetical protein [bacterium]